jgi:hypothetical protein
MRELKPIAIIVFAALVVVLAFLLLSGGTTEVVIQPRAELPPPGDVGPGGTPIAVVAAMHEDNETSLLGLITVRSHFIVGVQFYAPAGCAAVIGDDAAWPVAEPECRTEVPISGSVAGTGVAATGETIVLVDTEVTEQCFDALSPGDLWPSDTPSCAQPATD